MGFEYTLGDYVALVRGTTYKGALVNLPGPVLLGLASIQSDGGFRWGAFKTYGGECPSKITLSSGDLYVSLKDVTQSGDLLGSVARVPKQIDRGRLTQDTVKLELSGRPINSSYLYWLLRTPQYREYCRSRATGTTTLGLAREDFLAFPIADANPEQDSLVELLEGIEERIELLGETNATLEAMAQALFKSWFVDFDPVHANAGTRAATLPAELQALFPSTFTDTPQGPVPEGWRVVCLGDTCQIASGKRPEVRSDLESEGAKVPLYGGAGIMGYTDKPLFDEKKILTGRVGTLGKVHIATPPFWASDNVLVLTPRNKSNFYFSLNWLLSIDVKALNRGSTQPLLTQKDLGAQQRVLPSNEILAEFENMVSELYLKIHANTQQTQTLATLRDTLLPRLISGQLRLPDAAAALTEAVT